MKVHFELPRIKICGLTHTAEVQAVAAAGADAIGLVAAPQSPRFVQPWHARALVAALAGGVRAILVFVDTSPAQAREWLAQTGAHAVQLCGRESPSDWRDFEAPILRRLAVDDSAEGELEGWLQVANGFVLDHPSQAGGSGQRVDLVRAAALCRRAPCLLAGGLDPANVAASIRSVEPHGVDASSRLERTPGTKDLARVHEFVLAARTAFEECRR